MNLTWHIVKKDLRALKWPVALWTLVIVTKLGIGVAMLTATSSLNADWLLNWFVRMDMFTKVLSGLECVSFVLVAALIHEDLLVGTTAFWVTRPISGARLLGAKFLGIGLIFGVLPVLVTLPWWLGCGYGMREIAWAALETVAVQAICVLLGLLWAVVTDGFARFLLWTLVLLFAIPSIGGGIGLVLSTLKAKPTHDLGMTRIWVVIAIAVAAILAITVHQFLTRRTGRSIGLIVTAVGLMVATGLWWPWDWRLNSRWHEYLLARAELGPALSPEPPGLQFAVDPPRLLEPPGAPAGRFNQIRTRFSVSGIPPGQALFGDGGSFVLAWPDGATDTNFIWIDNNDNIFRRAASNALGLSPLPAAEPDRQRFTIPLYLSLAKAARVQAEAPGFTLKPTFRLVTFDSVTKLPLQPGPRILTGKIGARVAHVETEDQHVLVVFVRSQPSSLVERLTYYRYHAGQVGSDQPFFAVFNQAEGKLDTGYTQWATVSYVASVEIAIQSIAYGDLRPRSKKERAALPESWLRNAELVRATIRNEGERFTHEIKFDRFPVEPANP